MPDGALPVLDVRDLKTVFQTRGGEVHAVNDVSFSLRPGELLGVVGESGSGKTTMALAIMRLIASEGCITYKGQDIRSWSTKQLRHLRKDMQIVFQDPHSSLNPSFTIFGSLEDPLKQYSVKSKAERRQIIGDLLEAVNMRREYMDRYPHEFSGGQRQRIGIARALCVGPELVVCDEAVSALDVSVQAQVLKLLMDLKVERNLTYVFITHDLSVTEYLCDRIAVMYLGRIVEMGPRAAVFENPQHPYTQALISAVPIPDPVAERARKRITLPGDLPSPLDVKAALRFLPSKLNAGQHDYVPQMQEVAPGHFVAEHDSIEDILANSQIIG